MSKTIRRILFFGVSFLVLAFGVVVANQTLQLAQFAERIHPTFGVVVFWTLLALYALFLLVPVFLYYRLPPALRAPESDEGPEFDRHLDRLRRRLSSQPITAGAALDTREQIEQAIALLDEKARVLMTQSASRVFLTTAVSQNGSLDALVVLAAQVKLVWDVAHLYAQRPTLREMGTLYANVLGTAFVAGQLEEVDLSEQIQPVLSGVLGSAAGALPGFQAASTVFVASVITGSANAFLTLRVGAIATEYCGALVRKERGKLRRMATVRALGMLGSITVGGAAKISKAIATASGRRVGGALSGIGSKVKGAGEKLMDRLSFGRRENEQLDDDGGVTSE